MGFKHQSTIKIKIKIKFLDEKKIRKGNIKEKLSKKAIPNLFHVEQYHFFYKFQMNFAYNELAK